MKVALIGAGPRALLVLARLLAHHTSQPQTPLDVTLFDPYNIGGRVWRVDQDPHLIMNTAAQHITLFYDQTVASPGPFTQGPSLAQWAAGPAADYLVDYAGPNADRLRQEITTLTPNSMPSRVVFGLYQRWVYAELLRRKAESATVTLKLTTVNAVSRTGETFTLETSDGRQDFDAVVMALGNNANSPTREQKQLQEFADAHDFLYLPPNFPAEGDLSPIAHGDTVILRGLGLSFFDYMSRLTEGRGGTFTRNPDQTLTYQSSGEEPHIVAGSRRGLPYHAKGRNEKSPGEEWQPRFLTQQQLDNWAANRPIPAQTFWQALQNEAEYIYYSLLLPQTHPALDLDAFQADFQQNPAAALDRYQIPVSERLDWDALMTPPLADSADAAVRAYLAHDIEEAKRGTKTGPLTSALEVLRDMRDGVRQVVSRGLLSDDDYLDFFLRWFNGANDFLSIGPPVIRLEQLLALMDAGVVDILPPHMTVGTEADHFVAGTADDSTVKFFGTALIEARVPGASARTAQNPLIKQLLHDDMATTYELQLVGDRRFQSGAVSIDRQTMQLLDAKHRPQGKLFFWGVPTEGVKWLTTASPRPFVNDVSLREANRIAMAILADGNSGSR